jgi:hypothetical protein
VVEGLVADFSNVRPSAGPLRGRDRLLVVEEEIGLIAVGVKLDVWRRCIELNVAGRLADGPRAARVAGPMICCGGGRGGRDRRGGSPCCQQRGDQLHPDCHG